MLSRSNLVLAAAAVVFAAAPAPASDGVIEINQASALAGNITPGDTAGFPVTISASGSYLLTGNLDITAQGNPAQTTAVEITSDNVTLDLGGFAILGANVCTGDPPLSALTCNFSVVSPPFGIGVRADTRYHVVIKNGVIRGMGTFGVLCDSACSVENLQVGENGVLGIGIANTSGRVDGCTAYRNGDVGIQVSGSILDSVATKNGGAGFSVISGTAKGNVSTSNGAAGFSENGALLIDNHAYNNKTFGISFSGSGGAWGRNRLAANGTAPTGGTSGVQVDVNDCDGSPCP